MARSASDATRFTPSHPHVAAKQYPRPSHLTLPDSPPPPNETPQQKVARLRAAAANARLGQESQFDRWVLKGRKVADKAHRITAWSLIGLSRVSHAEDMKWAWLINIVVCGVFSAFAIGDMIMHNRRKRNEWLALKQDETARLTEEARVAFAAGSANHDQMLLLNRERAASDAEARRTGSVIKRDDDARIVGDDGLSSTILGTDGRVAAAAAAVSHNSDPSNKEVVKSEGTRPIGGPLDYQAQQISQGMQSWTKWLMGRR